MTRKVLVLVALCSIPATDAVGQAPPAPPAASPAAATREPAFRTAGAFFALSVADAGASAAWYSEKFGMRIVMDARSDNARAIVLSGGGLMVELVQQAGAVPLRDGAPNARGAVFLHGIFKVGLTVENFDQTLATLRERGVQIAMGPFPARADSPANVIVRDNEGNYIQIFAR